MIFEADIIDKLGWIVVSLSVMTVLIKIISKIKSTPRTLKKEIGKEIFQESIFLLARFALEYEPQELYDILKKFAGQRDLQDDMHATIGVMSDVFSNEGAFKDSAYFKELDEIKRKNRYKILTKRKKWNKLRYSEKVDDALGKIYDLWLANRKIRILKADEKSNKDKINKIIFDIESKKASNRERRKVIERKREKEKERKEIDFKDKKKAELWDTFKH